MQLLVMLQEELFYFDGIAQEKANMQQKIKKEKSRLYFGTFISICLIIFLLF